MRQWEPAFSPPTLEPGEVHVYRVRIAGAYGGSVLSSEERARADRFVFERDRHQFAGTRVALRRLLGGLLMRAPETVVFAEGPHGKPHLAGADGERLRFNVSHTGDLSLLAVALDREVGVDVERHRRETEVDELAPQVCEGRELAAFRALPATARREAFFALWAGKEAVLKALGSGLTVSPWRVALPQFPWTAPCRVHVDGLLDASFDACPFRAGEGLSAAVAFAGDAPTRLRLLDLPRP